MVEIPNNAKINMYLQLDNVMQLRLDEINKTREYFIPGI